MTITIAIAKDEIASSDGASALQHGCDSRCGAAGNPDRGRFRAVTSVWYGIGVPKNTPAEIVGKLNNEINAAPTDPKLNARFVAVVTARRAGPRLPRHSSIRTYSLYPAPLQTLLFPAIPLASPCSLL
jgi:hypothetical protein